MSEVDRQAGAASAGMSVLCMAFMMKMELRATSLSYLTVVGRQLLVQDELLDMDD